MPEQQYRFHFRRVTGRGVDYSEVVIRSGTVAAESDTVFYIDSNCLPDSRYIRSIIEGIELAREQAGPQAGRILLEVLSARDVSGESSPFGIRECARGAALSALGLPHLCPNPGVGVET